MSRSSGPLWEMLLGKSTKGVRIRLLLLIVSSMDSLKSWGMGYYQNNRLLLKPDILLKRLNEKSKRLEEFALSRLKQQKQQKQNDNKNNIDEQQQQNQPRRSSCDNFACFVCAMLIKCCLFYQSCLFLFRFCV
eukprot:GHVS01060420.1.p2 GENE.GHVS01060420.1~~GHVS01060420.1.p2  ORF type:complete len:133 (+),score=22.59 GHVS01060420.1:331-729(+)